MIYQKDTSTIFHWFGFWLIVLVVAVVLQSLHVSHPIIIGILVSQIFWFIKELIFDKYYRKQPFNVADVIGGWLFIYVFKELIKTQTDGIKKK